MSPQKYGNSWDLVQGRKSQDHVRILLTWEGVNKFQTVNTFCHFLISGIVTSFSETFARINWLCLAYLLQLGASSVENKPSAVWEVSYLGSTLLTPPMDTHAGPAYWWQLGNLFKSGIHLSGAFGSHFELSPTTSLSVAWRPYMGLHVFTL